MADDSSDIDQPSVVDAAIAQWFQELDRGTAPSQSEFIARFPHITQQLTEFFADFNRFAAHQSARPVEADSSESASSAIDPSRTPTQLETSDSERIVDEAFLTVSVRYFGDYELVREIARGGMGIVYEARQRSLNRPVALKMILAGRLATAAEVARFRREAEAAARLEHPGIVPIHEIGQHGDQHYFTMGLVDGQSLSAKLQERPLLPREAALLVRDVAIAVQFAHSRGVVHRDLKPSNILLGTSSGNSPGELPYSPRVTDFGLAKLARTDQSLTETGQILGTPSYMPPEQAAGLTDEIGPAADIYALGAILYACLTGRPPFQSASALDTVKQVLERDPVSLRELDSTIPKDLETICLKCLEKSIPRRYATAQDVADELQRFLDGRPIQARPVTSLERMGRWCRRNPLVASLSAAVALSLIAGIAVSSYLAWEKNQLAIRERNAKNESLTQTRIATEALHEQERLNGITEAALKAEAIQKAAAEESAQRALESAKTERQLAEKLRQSLYLADSVRLPELAERHQTAEMTRTLRRHIPAPGQADLRGFDWYYWWDKVRLQGNVVEFPAPVDRIALSPDSALLVAGCGRQGYLWDIEARARHPRVVESEGARWAALSFAPDSQMLFGASENGMPKAWNLRTGDVVADGIRIDPESLMKNPKFVESYRRVTPRWPTAFSPDGRQFVGPDNQLGLLALWDLPLGIFRQLPEASEGYYVTPSRTLDGSVLRNRASFYRNTANSRLVRVDIGGVVETGRAAAANEEWGAPAFGTAFSPDGKWMACGMRAGQVLVFDLIEQSLKHRLMLNTDVIWDVAFSPDGQWLAAGSHSGTVRTWNLATGRPGSDYLGHSGPVRVVRFLPDGLLLASAGDDSDIHLWRRENGESVHRYRGHADRVTSLAISTDGSTLWSAGRDHTVRRWPLDISADRFAHHITGTLYGIMSSQDGMRVASAGALYASDWMGMPIWNGTTGKSEGIINPGAAQNQIFPKDSSLSPDGKLMAVQISIDVRIFDAHNSAEVASWPAANRAMGPTIETEEAPTNPSLDDAVAQFEFTPDSRQILQVSRNGKLEVRDARTGELNRKGMSPLAGGNITFQFAAGGRFVYFAAGSELAICQWPDLQQVKRITLPVPANSRFLAIEASHNGECVFLIAQSAIDGKTRQFPCLIDGGDWSSVHSMEVDRDPAFHDGLFSRDGLTLFTVHLNQVAAWDVRTRERKATKALKLGMGGGLWGKLIAFARENDSVLLSGPEGRPIEWNWRTNEVASVFEQQRRLIEDLSWSADGQTLIGHYRDNLRSSPTSRMVVPTAWRIVDGAGVTMPLESSLPTERQAFALAPRRSDLPPVILDVQAFAKQKPRPAQLGWLADSRMQFTPVSHARINLDAQCIATVHRGDRIVFWKRATPDQPKYTPAAFAEMPTRKVMWAEHDPSLCAFALENGVAVLTSEAKVKWRAPRAGGVNSVNWSDDGQFLVTAEDSGTVRLWDAATGELKRSLPAHTGSATVAVVPPDGHTIISGGSDGQIFIFDRNTGDLRLKLGEHRGGVQAMALSPDRLTLATSGGDGDVRLWRTCGRDSVGQTIEPTKIPPGLVVNEKRGIGSDGWQNLPQPQPASPDATASSPPNPDAPIAARLRDAGVAFEYELVFNRERFVYSPQLAPNASPRQPAPPLPVADYRLTTIPASSAITVAGSQKPGDAMAAFKPAEFTALTRLQSLSSRGAAWSAADIAELRDLPSLKSLNLAGTRLGDTDEALFCGLNSLQTLNLRETGVGDQIITRIAALPDLALLDLAATAVTDEGIKRLAGHQRLKTLDLEQTRVTDACLPALADIPSLSTLNVQTSAVTLDGYLGLLAANPDVRLQSVPPEFSAENPEFYEVLRAQVEIDGKPATITQAIQLLRQGQHITGWSGLASQLRENDFAILDRLPSLNSIIVTSSITNTPLRPLTRAANRLTSLSIRGKNLGDSQLKELAGLQSLKRLHLSETQISPAGLKALRSLPLVALRIEGSRTITMAAIVETFPGLRELSVENCSLADGDAAQVAGLKHLEILNISRNRTSELTTAALKKLPKLRWFSGSLSDVELMKLRSYNEMPRVD